MKKCLIYITLLFALFFSHQYFVNADDSTINVNFCDSSNTCSGNNEPFNWVSGSTGTPWNYQVILSNPSNSNNRFVNGERYRVVSSYCTYYTTAYDTFSITSYSNFHLTLNDYSITNSLGSCQHTDSNGNVHVGNNTIYISVDFTITDINTSAWARFNVIRQGNRGFQNGFDRYSILTGSEINANQNAQDIINNQNYNADRIINAQNGTTNAVNNNTTAINNMNGNMTSTNTSGSESFLTSIINDPTFQDNTGINGIIQLPLAMISSLSNQCSPIDITIPFLNVNTQLPCISSLISQKMPAVANILRIAVNGFVLYRIFIDIVGLIKSARNPDEDRLDVLEL